jgi:xanthine dehydrogenase YagS FAD-binding subunit
LIERTTHVEPVMPRFEYAAPATLRQALTMLAERPGAAVLAGGSDLLSLLKEGIETPPRLVALRGIPELHGIEPTADGGLRLGATTSLAELLADTRVGRYAALREALESIRAPQELNVATFGGELCQRPRCWYYRNGFGLVAQRSGRSMAPDGDNRYHAVLGGGPVYFVSPSRMAPALVALDARVHVTGLEGERELAAESFFRVPRAEAEREHDLAAGEIVTAVVLPARGDGRSASHEVRQRDGLERPLVAAAAALRLDAGRVGAARIALGQVAPVPWRAREAEDVLLGRAPDEQAAADAAEAALASARPLSGNAYKVRLARVALRRAVLRAAGRES